MPDMILFVCACVCVHGSAIKEAQWQAREERAKQYYEKQLEEKKRKLEEQRVKEEKRRAAVEEKRRQKIEEDKVRHKCIMVFSNPFIPYNMIILIYMNLLINIDHIHLF